MQVPPNKTDETLTSLIGVASGMFWTLFGYSQWAVSQDALGSECHENYFPTLVGTNISSRVNFVNDTTNRRNIK